MQTPSGDSALSEQLSGPAPPPEVAALSIEEGQDAAEGTRFNTAKALNYSVANFGAQAFYTLFLTAMPFYLETYRLRPELIGLLANERSFVASFVQPFVGRISDRIRTPLGKRRPFFLIGIPLVALSLFVLAQHPPFWVMLGFMTVTAFFLSVAWDPYMALMADVFPPQQRGRVGGFVGLANGLGAISFLLLAFTLWTRNEGLVFGLVIVILVLTFGYTFFTVKEPAAEQGEQAGPRVARRPDPAAYFRGLLGYREAAKYSAAIFLFWLGAGGATPFVTLFGEHALRASRDQSFLLPIMFTVSTALFAVPAGYLADRIGKKRVMTLGLVLYGLFALIGSQSGDLMQGTLALAVIGIGNAGLVVLNPLLTDLIPKRRTAELIGLASAVFSFAQPLGSVLAGVIVGVAQTVVGANDAYRWAFIFAGAAILSAALVLQTVRPERVDPEAA